MRHDECDEPLQLLGRRLLVPLVLEEVEDGFGEARQNLDEVLAAAVLLDDVEKPVRERLEAWSC